MITSCTTAFVFIIIIASFSFSQVYAYTLLDNDYTITRFTYALEYPTAMTFVGEDILVIEKNTGKVIQIQYNDKMVTQKNLVLDLPVSFPDESGMLGITSISNHVYLHFTESMSGSDQYSIENSRQVVYRYDWTGDNLINPVLIKELPTFVVSHAGGAITKGQNDEIYFVIGDQDQRTTFQNLPIDTIHETGSIFKLDTKSDSVELFAMGIRNSFGLAVDPITGYLWDTENGPVDYDEINLVKPRFNSGWVSIMGPSDRNDSDLSHLSPKPFEDFVYSDPEFSWHKSIAVTAIAFPDKHSISKHSDSLFVGDFNHGRIYNFQLNFDRTEFVFASPDLSDLVLDPSENTDEILFAEGFAGITDIQFHNGEMYVVVLGDGSIYKIYPKKQLSPLKQHQNGVPHNKIVCAESLMPIMSKSISIYCVSPKTAITLINVLNWSIDHSEMPKIELMNQDLQGLNFEYINLSNSDLRAANFDTAKISNANLAQANLTGVDISGMDLTGTILTGADLSYANLDGVDLSGKDLTGTIFIGADLTDANLENTVLTNAILNCVGHSICITIDDELPSKSTTDTDLPSASTGDFSLSGRDLTGLSLIGIDLSGMDLTGTVLTGADLTDANLDGVDLSGKDLTVAILTGVDLSDTNLTGTILKGVDLSNKNLTGAILTGVDLSDTNLTGTILKGADLSYANLFGVDLSDKDLTGVMLTGVNLSGVDLTNTILVNANLENAILTDAKLLDANLSHANLTKADLIRALLVDVNFENAILREADLTGAILTGAILTGANLENAVLTNAILNCVGHPICV